MPDRRLAATLVMLGAMSWHPIQAQTDPRASGGPLPLEQAAYDVRFYDLAVAVSPDDSSITGAIVVHADVIAPLETFVLDLDTVFGIIETSLDGTALSHERRGGQLWISLPRRFDAGERVAVRVAYAGKPRSVRRGGFDGFIWTQTPDGLPWITVSCELFGADLWWPTKDHLSDEPDSMALHITVERPLVVAANGRLRSITESPAGRTFHWFVSTPINNYGVSLNIAPYVEVVEPYASVTGDTIPVTFWVLRQNAERARRALREFFEQMRHLEDLVGPYPFRADKYGLAETPYLGMEHQTIIAYGANFRNDAMAGIDWGFDGLHQHELAHEWFGNQVTPAAWQDLWLNEAFAQYAQPLYAESRLGQRKARELLAIYRRRVANRQPVAPRDTLTSRQAYTGDIYFKGALVLHSLRYLLGDDAFFTMLRRWTYPHPAAAGASGSCQCRLTSTDELVLHVNRFAGRRLDWFFEVYVRQAALPRLVSRRTTTELELTWEVPGGAPFPMPIDVRIGAVTRRVEMPDGSARIPVREGAEVVVDPDGWVLRAVEP
jgi:aminopeptidase N